MMSYAQEQLPSSENTVPLSTLALEMVQDEEYQTNLEGNGKSQTTGELVG